ncbi:conserved hypothetical protein [Mesorhizobium ventifaucium]|uniref:Uncharacterized protein n=1 Tax=Mesorhizobium ventifaucium TaxID=666020 RepID=A0ABM9DCR7_9HYPH|nr:conserved hypothetical protein [Mesorhizobium ventifaucium]
MIWRRIDRLCAAAFFGETVHERRNPKAHRLSRSNVMRVWKPRPVRDPISHGQELR